MTETQLRNLYVNTAIKYLGYNEADGSHKEIVDIYNTITPLPAGYKLAFTDSWCAGFVSAMAKLIDLDDIVLCECSCRRMINRFKSAGRWKETDSYKPQKGDLIMYDWDDSGSGDNTGNPEHVGIVVSVSGSTIKVIEGNKSNKVAYRSISVNGRYIRGYCLPDFASKAGSVATEDTSKVIWDHFLDKLGNAYGVAGLMGNLQAESGLYPDRVQGDNPYSAYSQEYTAQVDNGTISEYDFVHNGPNGGGYGLAQWTYSTRKQGLYDLYKSGGYSSIGALDLALDYLWQELQADFPGVVSVLKSAGSVRVASDKVLHDFERPANQSTSTEEKRATMGQAWYDKYAGSTPGGGDTPGGDETLKTPWKPTSKGMGLMLMIMATRRDM